MCTVPSWPIKTKGMCGEEQEHPGCIFQVKSLPWLLFSFLFLLRCQSDVRHKSLFNLVQYHGNYDHHNENCVDHFNCSDDFMLTPVYLLHNNKVLVLMNASVKDRNETNRMSQTHVLLWQTCRFHLPLMLSSYHRLLTVRFRQYFTADRLMQSCLIFR